MNPTWSIIAVVIALVAGTSGGMVWADDTFARKTDLAKVEAIARLINARLELDAARNKMAELAEQHGDGWCIKLPENCLAITRTIAENPPKIERLQGQIGE